MKKILIIISSALILVVILVFALIYSMPDMSPEYKIVTIDFGSHRDPLYLESKTWGLTYDHTIAIVSNHKGDFTEDSSKVFVFKQPNFLFYRANADTLWLYVYSKAPIPTLLKSKIKVIEIELENPDMMSLKTTHRYRGKKVEEFSDF